MAQERKERLNLNGENQIMIYADDINLPGANTKSMKRNTHDLVDAITSGGLEVTAERTNCMFIY
jgi:hypothetical protein